MTKIIKNINDGVVINELIAKAELEYQSDISWSYEIENSCYAISFYKDENGKNQIENFHRNHKGMWIELVPTDEQIKLMFDRLNQTPYREVEKEMSGEFWGENLYEKYGVSQSNFY